MPNPSPVEDSWAWNLIETPFPDGPVKAFGQQNMYIGLWYKNGKPTFGLTYNDGGIVKCSFPYALLKVELSGKRDLGGQIQILQYKDNHLKVGFWYNWMKFSECPKQNDDKRELVRCGSAMPILWSDRPEGALMGSLDMQTEVAAFPFGGKCIFKQGDDLKNMMVIVRELHGGPNGCVCHECSKDPKPVVRVMLNEWADFRAGDPFPTAKLVQALSRPLNTLPGEDPNQYVALWYIAGQCICGRIWNQGGKIAANFGANGHEYKNNVGSIQVLFELSEHVRGFDYAWQDFKAAAASKFEGKEWIPVHVDCYKGDVSPGVLIIDGKEVLGNVDIRNERASIGYGGTEKVLVGPAVHSCKVLCRKARPGCKFD